MSNTKVTSIEVFNNRKPTPPPMRPIDGVVVAPFGVCDRPTVLYVTTYVIDGSIALVGRDADTGQPAYKASVCLPNDPPKRGCMWIKDYAENAGISEALHEAGVIEFTENFAQLGDGFAFECKLLV